MCLRRAVDILSILTNVCSREQHPLQEISSFLWTNTLANKCTAKNASGNDCLRNHCKYWMCTGHRNDVERHQGGTALATLWPRYGHAMATLWPTACWPGRGRRKEGNRRRKPRSHRVLNTSLVITNHIVQSKCMLTSYIHMHSMS
jgi:hypothetical protein